MSRLILSVLLIACISDKPKQTCSRSHTYKVVTYVEASPNLGSYPPINMAVHARFKNDFTHMCLIFQEYPYICKFYHKNDRERNGTLTEKREVFQY